MLMLVIPLLPVRTMHSLLVLVTKGTDLHRSVIMVTVFPSLLQ